MTRNDRIADPLTTLRALDAAPATALTDGQRSRAAATLVAILASDPTVPTDLAAAPAGRPAPRRSRTRWLALTGAAAAAALAYTVLPLGPGPGTQDVAFATWTAVPTQIPLDAAGPAARYCHEHIGEHTDAETEQAARSATVAIAERRGVWTYILLKGDNGFQAICLTDTSFEDGMIGSVGTPLGYRAPAAREIRLANCCGGGGTITDGVKNLIGEVDGYAGSEVAKIVVVTEAKGKVEATVGGGQFAAWWPDNDSDTRPRTPMTFEVTYTDGTTDQVTLTPPQ